MRPLDPPHVLHPREAAERAREWAVYGYRNRRARDAYHGVGIHPGLKETVDRRYLGNEALDLEVTDG
jgi:hypothetical protein